MEGLLILDGVINGRVGSNARNAGDTAADSKQTVRRKARVVVMQVY